MDNSHLPNIRTTKQKAVTALIHLICIFILIFLPEVIMNLGDTHHATLPTGIYLKALLYLSVFYINYFFIIDRCLDHRHPTWKFISINFVILLISIAILLTMWKLNAADRPIHGPGGPPPHMATPPHHIHEEELLQHGDLKHFARSMSLVIRDIIIIIFSISLCLAIKLSQRWIRMGEKRQALVAAQREEELNNLKNQLNPHFLFNTLNSIYALIDISPEKAKYAIYEISHMLRYVIYENPASVNLEDELKFIKSYIELMKLRLGEKIPVKVALDSGNSATAQIAPLIFITIVENVFKHGNTGNPSQKMEISITAHDGIVECRTFNHFNPEAKHDDNGIGLQNLKRRLNLIYGDKATLSFNDIDNTFTVDLRINLNGAITKTQ